MMLALIFFCNLHRLETRNPTPSHTRSVIKPDSRLLYRTALITQPLPLDPCRFLTPTPIIITMKLQFLIASLVHSAVGFGIKHPSGTRLPSRKSLRSYTTSCTTSRTVRREQSYTALHATTNLPTIEQLSSDSFMNQVNYASEIVPLLAKENNHANLTEMISAQLR